MNTNKTRTLAVVVICLLATFVASAHPGNRVVPPGQEFHGKSYPQLADEWANWLTIEPFATNPALDPDGRFCELNQHGKVWFLASTFGGIVDRTCEIPAGKAIFLSLGGVFVSFAPEFPTAGHPCLAMGSTVDQVRCDVTSGVPVAPNVSFAVTLDGEPVEDLLAYRAQSEPGGFTLRVDEPSFLTDLGLPAGDRSPAVTDGYFLLLKPLHPGTHTLTLRMNQPGQPVAGVNYTLVIGQDE